MLSDNLAFDGLQRNGHDSDYINSLNPLVLRDLFEYTYMFRSFSLSIVLGSNFLFLMKNIMMCFSVLVPDHFSRKVCLIRTRNHSVGMEIFYEVPFFNPRKNNYAPILSVRN